METIDISILKEKPSLSKEINLIITPLAPLSMAADFPGKFYKTLGIPNKKMICGLIENILGWHFSVKNRKEIIKYLQESGKKQKSEFNKFEEGSNYIPLLMDYFEIKEQKIEGVGKVIFYKDYWKRMYSRLDSEIHAKGTINMDYQFIVEKNKSLSEGRTLFFKEYKEKYPLYYTTPTLREYIFLDGSYQFTLEIDSNLVKLLENNLRENNLGYLGTSEGWVDIRLCRK